MPVVELWSLEVLEAPAVGEVAAEILAEAAAEVEIGLAAAEATKPAVVVEEEAQRLDYS